MQRAQAHREADVSDLLIESLHLDLQPKARMHRLRAHAMGLDVVFTAGFRTWAEQVALYEKGRQRSPDGWRVVDPSKVVTNALPEQAPHCRRAAYDLVPIVAERAAWDRLDLLPARRYREAVARDAPFLELVQLRLDCERAADLSTRILHPKPPSC
jgi:hypothetical protein